ncbi:MAG: type II toxin-antitoxin system Phd/YefM family antitoxin [Actinomycetota bacterium]
MEDKQVGVRELRQNLSKYLERIKRGERLEVTEHGRAVAILVPLPPAEGAMARLVAAGRVTPPSRDLGALLPPDGPVSTTLSRALADERADRL